MQANKYVFFIGCLLLISCKNSTRSSSEYVPVKDYHTAEVDGKDYREEYDDSAPGIGSLRLTGEIVQCNKCMGYGLVQDGLYGQPQICKFCWFSTNMRIQQGWMGFDGRYGQVDAVFNTLPVDYFDGLDWNGGGDYDDNAGETSADQIESEIARHEENIAQLERQLEYIEGSINRSQIQQKIIEEQYEIGRMKAMLNRLE